MAVTRPRPPPPSPAPARPGGRGGPRPRKTPPPPAPGPPPWPGGVGGRDKKREAAGGRDPPRRRGESRADEAAARPRRLPEGERLHQPGTEDDAGHAHRHDQPDHAVEGPTQRSPKGTE